MVLVEEWVGSRTAAVVVEEKVSVYRNPVVAEAMDEAVDAAAAVSALARERVAYSLEVVLAAAGTQAALTIFCYLASSTAASGGVGVDTVAGMKRFAVVVDKLTAEVEQDQALADLAAVAAARPADCRTAD